MGKWSSRLKRDSLIVAFIIDRDEATGIPFPIVLDIRLSPNGRREGSDGGVAIEIT